MNTDRRDTNLCVVVLTWHVSGMHKVIAAAPDRAVTDASKLTVAFRVMVLANLLLLHHSHLRQLCQRSLSLQRPGFGSQSISGHVTATHGTG